MNTNLKPNQVKRMATLLETAEKISRITQRHRMEVAVANGVVTITNPHGATITYFPGYTILLEDMTREDVPARCEFDNI